MKQGLMGKAMQGEPKSGPGEVAPARGGNTEGGPAQQGDEAELGMEQASAEEQQAYEQVVLAAMKVIYDDATHQKIMQALQGGRRPDSALADVTAAIVLQLDEQSKGKVPEVVILPAAMEILEMLAELGEKAGLFTADEAAMTAAAQQTVLALLQEYGTDPADVQAVTSKLDPARVKELVAQQQQAAASWAGEQGAAAQPQAQGAA